MRKYFLGLFLIVSLSSITAEGSAVEKLHCFKGYFVSEGTKYPVCVALFEHFVVSRGIIAFSGYMEYAIQFFGDVPLDPPSFSVLGNRTYDGKLIFSVFDRNNSSPDNMDLFVKTTDMSITGENWERLTLKQGNIQFPMTLLPLGDNEVCALQKLPQ